MSDLICIIVRSDGKKKVLLNMVQNKPPVCKYTNQNVRCAF